MEIVFDMRPFGNSEAHFAEYRRQLLDRLADRVQAPNLGRARRQGDIDLLRSQLGFQRIGLEPRQARLQRLSNGILHSVEGLAGGLALLRRQAAEVLHQAGNLTLLTERTHPHALQRLQVGGLGNLIKQVGPQSV